MHHVSLISSNNICICTSALLALASATVGLGAFHTDLPEPHMQWCWAAAARQLALQCSAWFVTCRKLLLLYCLFKLNAVHKPRRMLEWCTQPIRMQLYFMNVKSILQWCMAPGGKDPRTKVPLLDWPISTPCSAIILYEKNIMAYVWLSRHVSTVENTYVHAPKYCCCLNLLLLEPFHMQRTVDSCCSKQLREVSPVAREQCNPALYKPMAL